MQILLKKSWLGHDSGSEVAVNIPTGLRLIEEGVAKAVIEKSPPGHVTCTRCGDFVKLEKENKMSDKQKKAKSNKGQHKELKAPPKDKMLRRREPLVTK